MNVTQQTEDTEDVEEPKADPVARFTAGLRAGLPQFLLLGRVRPPGQPRPYEPRLATLSESRAAAQVRAVKDITEARFGFPTDRYRDYKTYSNIPQRSMGIAMPDDTVAYPDIVVVQNPENYAKIIGEVATAETVSEEVALRRWRPFAELAPLYLYVPVGEGDQARKLCRDLKVPIVGIRSWRYTVGVDQIEINDISTVPSGPEEMLPKILRPG
jgi:hypothetical protein